MVDCLSKDNPMGAEMGELVSHWKVFGLSNDIF